jgi:membrane associated rhomboid family serine protease/DNA-directed RNA polymerase subunit RPC12/RpoP
MMPPGITGEWMLRGWSLKGLLGYMWLHAGLFHLLGNMWFLWIFGNAVCARIGNLKYLLWYILLGMAAGVAHLLAGYNVALGASGAINGIVGTYLVLFYENEITCLWTLFFVYWRWFTISSIWMILFWLLWDILGAVFFSGSSNTAYFAHLGGFATGFGITLLLCMKGWIKMETHEKSLWQAWQERKRGRKDPHEQYYGRLGMLMKEQEQQPAPALHAPPSPPPPKIIPMIDPVTGNVERDPPNGGPIIVTCSSCGKSIKATRQYAGKVVLCPHCGGKVLVPDARATRPAGLRKLPSTANSMQAREACIRFRCHCGKAIKVPARLAGRSGKCPQCGSRIKVPYA